MAAQNCRSQRMIGWTLSYYIARKYTLTVTAMLVSMLVFIVLVDFVEQMRRAAEQPDIPIYGLLQLSSLKAPSFLEKAFPFCCLFAAMVTLTQLNQRMELVVARASGVSAWQFLMPVSVAAILIGLFASLVYNPIAVLALEKSKSVETRLFDQEERSRDAQISGYWLRQDDKAGSSVINARIAREDGAILDDVKIIRFDDTGIIYERVDAERAIFKPGRWVLTNAFVTRDDAQTAVQEQYEIDSRLTADILAGVTASPDTVPFWRLREIAAKAVLAGGSPDKYYTQFYNLLALPMFLVAMVLIAATVSLRFVRFGQVGRMILGGILSGFVLYTVTKFATSLGSNGIVPPIVAAWSPSVVAIAFGITILLHQEDG
jgi:lipopolysaccharide export system permease protein